MVFAIQNGHCDWPVVLSLNIHILQKYKTPPKTKHLDFHPEKPNPTFVQGIKIEPYDG